MKANIFFRETNHGGNVPFDSGKGEWRNGLVVPNSIGLSFDAKLNPRGVPFTRAFTNFNSSVPAAAVNTYDDDPFLVISGTNAAAVTWATAAAASVCGGLRFATAGADDDQYILSGAQAMSLGKIASSGLRFEALVSPVQTATTLLSVGFDENITNPDPSGTAGDGAKFLYVPYGEIGAHLSVSPVTAANGGLVEADFANWILHQKVNGTDYYYRTDVPVAAGLVYALTVEIGADLKPIWKINGSEVGELGSNAASTLAFKYPLTSGDTIVPNVMIQALAAAAKSVDVGFAVFDRFIW